MHTSLYELSPGQQMIAPAPRVAPSREPVPPPPTRSPRPYWHLLALLLITIIGGAFRFYRLNFPTLWNDEAKTYWRVCGTYAQMLVPLRSDGFPPLHYSLYWSIAQFTTLTPFAMRFVPALAGTLAIPAMYFLARQFLPRATALVAAAFVACSAFALFYSRDAKMYSLAWLCMILNVGCLLWWCRTRRSTAWLGWIASGCAMVGLHVTGLVIPAISLVFFLTQRRLHWRQSIFFAAGLLLIYAGPIGYYTKFNQWNENVEEQGWRASGITWLSWYNGDRTGPELAQYTGSAFLTGYEWPRPEYLRDIPEPLITLPMLATKQVLWILIAALLPWPMLLRPRREPGRAPEPPWRVLLWLSAWIVLPAYAFYCHSIRGFVSPRIWIDALVDWASPLGAVALLVAICVYLLSSIIHRPLRQSLLRFLQAALVIAIVYGLCHVVFGICHSAAADALARGRPWRSIWNPRYLGFTFPAIVLSIAALLMRLPTRPLRLAAIFFVLGVNVAMASLRVTLDSEPPMDRVAADVWASQPPTATVRTYVTIDRGEGTVAGGALHVPVGRYYLQAAANFSPMSPDAFTMVLTRFRLWRNMEARAIATDASATPRLQRLIVWTYANPATFNADRTVRAMKGWRLKEDSWYTARNYWDWRERWQMHRMEFVRAARPT